MAAARLQQVTTLLTLALALAWAGAWVHAGQFAWAAVGALMIGFGHAGLLAVEFFLMHRAHGADPTPRARLGQLLKAWCGEVVAMHVVFQWRQPFRSRRWPDHLPSTSRGRRGVLLVHGFMCNRGIWNRWLPRLTRRGVPVVAVDLEPVFGSIDDYVPCIEAGIERLERATGVAPIVVAHSMGGLALRGWWARTGNAARVHRAITIATPHHGAWMARLGTTPAARQMRVGSRWLQQLEAAEPRERASRFTCFYSQADNMVFPPVTATLDGADNRHLRAVAHVRMIDHDAAWNELLRRLDADAGTEADADARRSSPVVANEVLVAPAAPGVTQR